MRSMRKNVQELPKRVAWRFRVSRRFFKGEFDKFEELDSFLMLVETERLGKHVSHLFNGRNVLQVDLLAGVDFADVVEAGINVLCARVLYVVLDVFEGRF